MHILHINLAKGFRGGERQTGLLIDGLAKQYPTLKQSLLVRKGSSLPDVLEYKSNVNIIEIGKPFLGYVLKTKAKKSYSLIHAHDAKACHLAYFLNKVSHIPYIITRRMDRAPKDNWFTRKVYQQCKNIVCISWAIQIIIKKYTSNSSISVIPDMKAKLDFNEGSIQKIRKSLPKKIIVGHVGALVSKHKGQEYIVEAAKTLQQTHPSIHFLLLGEGKDEAALKQQAEALNNISFIGFKENVGDYLRAFDIFLFPSLEEGLGSTLLDAMEAQLPIIATNVGGIPDVIQHKKNGILINPKSANDIAGSILSLVEDKVLAKSLAKQGLSDSEQYSPLVISRYYMDTYKELTTTDTPTTVN